MLFPALSDNDTLNEASCNPQLLSDALACDHYHHYYHYQSSAHYLWLAETLRALGREEEATHAYTRAIFQDHSNNAAITGKANTKAEMQLPIYEKHPHSDKEFRLSVGQIPSIATELHDQALVILSNENYAPAITLLDKAIEAEPNHSNSFFLRGKIYFLQRDFEQACIEFTKAIQLSHEAHDRYHRSASQEHLARGREFYKRNEWELAVSDFTKALDLDKSNKEALKARAETYREKGALRLAEEDEKRLAL